MRRTNLDREVLIDKWHKHNLLAVPLLLGIDLHFASKPPALPTIPDQDLSKRRGASEAFRLRDHTKVPLRATASTAC